MAALLTKLIVRNDTTTQWSGNNPILLKGEIGIEWVTGTIGTGTDKVAGNSDDTITKPDTNTAITYKIKIGDGVSHWNDLKYFGGSFSISGTGNTIVSAAYDPDTGVLTLTKGDRVTGSGLTADKIIVGNDGVAIKTSSKGITTTAPVTKNGNTLTYSNDDNSLPTAKAVATALSNYAATITSGVSSVTMTDDDVVNVDKNTAQSGAVSFALSHATKGPSSNANTTKGPTADVTISGSTTGATTIKVPKVTVDKYGHTTGLSEYTLSITHPTASDLGLASALVYKGSVTTYSALPTSGQKTGDVWNIEQTDDAHSINAGDNVCWNGSAWDNLGNYVDLRNVAFKDANNHFTGHNTIDSAQIGNLVVTGGATGNFTGSLAGNASSADKVNHTLSFAQSGTGTSFNGSADVTVGCASIGAVKTITSKDNNVPRFDGTGGQLQGSRWSIQDNASLTISDGTNTKAGMINFKNWTTYGIDVKLGGGNLTVVGAGESADSAFADATNVAGEDLWLTADRDTYIATNGDTWANRKLFKFDTSGGMHVPYSAGNALDKTVHGVTVGTLADINTNYGCAGMQARNNGAASTAFINYYGGDISLGKSGDTTTVTTINNHLTYAGITEAHGDEYRPVWFAWQGIKGRPVYNTGFEYNPSSNTLKVGNLNLTSGGLSLSSLTVSGSTQLGNLSVTGSASFANTINASISGNADTVDGKHATNFMWAKSANGYYGLQNPDGTDDTWIRTTTPGFIPYKSGAAGSGHGSLGTSSWYFANAFIDTVHGSLDGTATQANYPTGFQGRTSSWTWGTLTAANGYTQNTQWDYKNGATAFATKNNQTSMQMDGFFYQNEGRYQVLDTGTEQTVTGKKTFNDITSATVGNLTVNGSATFANTIQGTVNNADKLDDQHGEYYLDTFNHKPHITRTFTSSSYYATSSGSIDTSTWYFARIKPTERYKPWRIKYRVTTICAADVSYRSETWATLTGCGTTSESWNACCTHANFNNYLNYCHYYFVFRAATLTGFNAGYGHALGVSILNSINYTSSSYPRTFKIELFECENCTVEVPDESTTLPKWGEGTLSSTNYGSQYSMDAVSRGLQETGDNDAGNYNVRYYYSRFIAGNQLNRCQLMVTNGNKIYSICNTDNNTGQSKTSFLTSEFDPASPILYSVYNGTRAAGTYLDAYFYQQILMDMRYTFNNWSGTAANSDFAAGDSVYLVTVPQASGKVKLYFGASGTDYKAMLTKTLPTTENGLVYIYLGQTYDSYQMMLILEHPAYIYKHGAIRPYLGDDYVYQNGDATIDSLTASTSTIGNLTVNGSATFNAGLTCNLTGNASTATLASKATAANITTTANAIAKYSNTTGTFANTSLLIDSNNNLDFQKVGGIKNIAYNNGIYWNPYVESETDGSNAASITVIKNGNGNGATVLQIKQFNDADDIVNVVTNASTGLKHNGNTVWTAANDGSGSGLDADLLDGVHASVDAIASTIAKRNADGDVNVVAVNMCTVSTSTTKATMIYDETDDCIAFIFA